MKNTFPQIKSAIEQSLQENTFVKISLGNYHGSEENLKNIYVVLKTIKNEAKFSFTYRYKTRDIVKNYSIKEAILLVENYLSNNSFKLFNLFTTQYDLCVELNKNNVWSVKKKNPSHVAVPSQEHDKQKNRKIEATPHKKYLQELKITDEKGNVFKNSQDKYKQINHYVEILSSLLKELPDRALTNVVDMGAGKGYLTFALYDYLNNVLKKPTQVVGVEFREDLVELCNAIAQKSDFKQLQFVEGAIETYENPEINVLIALHACDTATDDAIFKGITGNADLIVVAPCCHKQIRRAIEKNKVHNELDFLLKHGIFLERQAEMVTDGLRALILEYFGYATKVFQFISDAHTPKNVLIVGMKKPSVSAEEKEIIFQKMQQTKKYFGIDYHHLEKKMGL